MTICNVIILSTGIILMAASSGQCGINVTPNIVERGDTLTITATAGTQLSETPKITCSGTDVGNIEFKHDKKNSRITFDAPTLETSGECTITFGQFTGNFTVYSRSSPYIKEAVLWKQKGMSDTAILGHISKMATRDLEENKKSPSVFDGVSIEGDEVKQLRDASFSEDFITKLEGQPQWVTIGMAAIFLPDGGKITTAPLLRIMLEPKSYYKPRYKFGHIFSKDFFSVARQKFDVNIGYTVSATKIDSENVNFLLTGFSYEINPSALLNFGAAIPTGGVKDKSVTSYVGVTVDQNFLKAIGLME
ncbi:hypothetical protein KI809_17075 [Geobacter pelophilus]|uniref:Uncharacterized protein n=1 Tax=Geoanaerobacter pelophilus TaxID=60036 RepID=A0AAW4L904_9BACT|nr:hypothetical protein [Geoanaerobacter pelophilus]MBT0666027.1 hypothetical protein [Geoanaerobacter pelophilus]